MPDGGIEGQTCGFQSLTASNEMFWEGTRRNLLPQGNQNRSVLPMQQRPEDTTLVCDRI